MTTMFFNCGIAQFHKSKERIAHLGDRGSENHHEQLDSAHSVISEWERRHGNSNAGAIAFDFDHRVSALQAADAIAWTLHRQRESEQFGNDFLPLLALSEKQYGPTGKSVRQHHCMVVPKHEMSAFADSVKNWIDSMGKLPLATNAGGSATVRLFDQTQCQDRKESFCHHANALEVGVSSFSIGPWDCCPHQE